MPTAQEVKAANENQKLIHQKERLEKDPSLKGKFLRDTGGRVYSWSPALATKEGMEEIDAMPKELIPKTTVPTSTVMQDAEEKAESEKKAIFDAKVAEEVEKRLSEKTTKVNSKYSDLDESTIRDLCEAREINVGNTKNVAILIEKLEAYDKAQGL